MSGDGDVDDKAKTRNINRSCCPPLTCAFYIFGVIALLVQFSCFISFKYGYIYPRYREHQICWAGKHQRCWSTNIQTDDGYRRNPIYDRRLDSGIEGFRTFDIQYDLSLGQWRNSSVFQETRCIRGWCFKRKMEIELQVHQLSHPSMPERKTVDAAVVVKNRYRFTFPRTFQGLQIRIIARNNPILVNENATRIGKDKPEKEEINHAFTNIKALGNIQILPILEFREKFDLLIGPIITSWRHFDEPKGWGRVETTYFTDMHE